MQVTKASRQRVMAALRCEEPDRVPFLDPVIDEAVALPLLGKPLPADSIGGELGTGDEPVFRGMLLGSENYDAMDLVDYLDLDGFGMYLFLKHEGIQEQSEGHYMVHGGRIKNRADFEQIHLPDPDDPALYEPYRSFIEKYQDTGRALFCFLNLGSDPVILGMGFETFSYALYDDRILIDDLFSLYTGWYARAVKHLCDLGFDFLWFGDDIAFKTGPYVSPRVFRELFIPHYRRVVENITIPWIYHSDGNVLPVLDDLLDLGMSGLHPIEPEAMEISELKQRYHGEVCLCGNISVDALCRATPQEIDTLVYNAIQVAAPGGGYIAGSANSIPYYARPDNVIAMQRAIRKYGKYPMTRED